MEDNENHILLYNHNHRGGWCCFANNQLFCQEGTCRNCEIFVKFKEKTEQILKNKRLNNEA